MVETPNARLRQLTLVDTPGIASSSVEVSAATREFLVDGAPGVDAVLYLMRHVHAEDVGFLQSFHDDAFAGTAPVNAIGVLSRADEMSGGAPNALDVAATIADRYAADDRVRALVQTVLPVSGLLALAAVRLSEPQFAALQQVSAAPTSLLLSADRFLRAAGDPALEVRAELMDAFGMFGIRHAVGLIRLGRATDAATLARVLQAECGLEELRRLLAQRFLGRAEVLKAEAALRVVEAAVTRVPVDGADQLRHRIEAVIAGAHELTELRTVTALRTGALELESAEQSAEVERLLGADGDSVRQRLGLAAEVPDEELRPALIATIQRWQRDSRRPVRRRRDPACGGGGAAELRGPAQRKWRVTCRSCSRWKRPGRRSHPRPRWSTSSARPGEPVPSGWRCRSSGWTRRSSICGPGCLAVCCRSS